MSIESTGAAYQIIADLSSIATVKSGSEAAEAIEKVISKAPQVKFASMTAGPLLLPSNKHHPGNPCWQEIVPILKKARAARYSQGQLQKGFSLPGIQTVSQQSQLSWRVSPC